ncbi:LOW QUALITY PROTEIN: hypothetical protein MAR_017331, partial [Mya arenaria]
QECPFCNQPIDDSKPTVALRDKGCDTINRTSKDRDLNIHVAPETVGVILFTQRNDLWSKEVLNRISSVLDHPAADAVYHQKCKVNFRTSRLIPRCYSDACETPPKKSPGMPDYVDINESFNNVHEGNILTLSQLTTVMEESCGERAYTKRHLKSKLLDHFGENISISTLEGKEDMMTVAPKKKKEKHHNRSSKVIKTEIDASKTNKLFSPNASSISSTEENKTYIPDSLILLLSSMFSTSDDVELASIGQAIIQACRPKSILAPLQLANAAATLNTNLPDFFPGKFLQFVADNVDHNACTLDGHGTFHGMGIIACTSPGSDVKMPIPKKEIPLEEILELGKIRIKFVSHSNSVEPRLDEHFDLFSKIIWSLNTRRPSWSGIIQMYYKEENEYPENWDSIHANDKFEPKVLRHSSKYGVTPVITFDQPLFQKATNIVAYCTSTDPLKKTILRLSAFHTEMRSIGHIMSGSGLQEAIETVYAPNAVTYMMNGKSFARALRGHFLLDTAVHAMLLSKTLNIDMPVLKERFDSQTDQIENKTDADADFQDLVCNNEIDLHGQFSELTALLWFQYMEMISILHQFIRAERVGDWNGHLNAVRKMLPHFAASGHNLYLVSLHPPTTYDHPDVHKQFMMGSHTLRRGERYWAGLSTDLVIEQVLMRSLKSTGGVTRGLGVSEIQMTVWLMSLPANAEMNNAMQQFTGTTFTTSHQHKETNPARTAKDDNDTRKLLAFLQDYTPFDVTLGVQNIGQNYHRPSTFRLTAIADWYYENVSGLFKYELSSVLSSLFDNTGLPRLAQKSQLADAMLKLGDCAIDPAENNIDKRKHFVIDGGSLLHRIPWANTMTFGSIFDLYLNYITQRFSEATVVFDGYLEGPSIKDTTHLRRCNETIGNQVKFGPDTPFKSKKDSCLSNSENKQTFIKHLGSHLVNHGITVRHATGDADLLIVETAIEHAQQGITYTIGEDTDLLVLICYHVQNSSHKVYMRSDIRQNRPSLRKIWDFQKTQSVLTRNVCDLLPFLGSAKFFCNFFTLRCYFELR